MDTDVHVCSPPFPDERLDLSFPETVEWLMATHFRPDIESSWGGRWPDGIPSCLVMANVLLNGVVRRERPNARRIKMVEREARKLQRWRSQLGRYQIPAGYAEKVVAALGLDESWLDYLRCKVEVWNRSAPAQRVDSARHYRKSVLQQAIGGARRQSLALTHPDLLPARNGIDRLRTYYREVFGGRSVELSRLDDFLNDESTPYLLIREPMGRGKTALLVNWVESLLAGSDWSVVFVPVSLRFGTDRAREALGIWADQLASFHGTSLGTEPLEIDWLRSKLADSLQRDPKAGGKVVIVLDGVDEASDWDLDRNLFPASLPSWMKVVVGTRELAGQDRSACIAQLGWSEEEVASLPLGLLDRGAIEEVLGDAGYALDDCEGHVQAVKEVGRVSEGDPILVRLLAQDLVDGRLAPDELTIRPQGLTEYFRHELSEIDDRAGGSRDIAYLLGACWAALGSLSADDCVALRDVESGKAWSRLEIASAAESARRFLIGDGREATGYAFQLATVQKLYGEAFLSSVERQRFAWAFVEWGKQAWSSESPQFPAYLRRYWMSHLALAGEWQTVERVLLGTKSTGDWLEHPWAAMSMRHERSYANYLSGIAMLRDHAEKTDRCGTAFHCALIASTVSELYRSFSGSLLRGLVEIGTSDGQWSIKDVLAAARLIPGADERAEALLELASIIPQDKRRTILEMAEEAARESDQMGCAWALMQLTTLALEPDRDRLLEASLAAARAVDDPVDRMRLMEDLLSHVGEDKREPLLKEALKARAAALKSDPERYSMGHVLNDEQYGALQAALSMRERAQVLSSLLPYLTEDERSGDLADALGPHGRAVTSWTGAQEHWPHSCRPCRRMSAGWCTKRLAGGPAMISQTLTDACRPCRVR